MIDLELIRKNRKTAAENLARRGVRAAEVEELYEADKDWRRLTTKAEELRSLQNEANGRVAAADAEARNKLIAELKKISAELAKQEQKLPKAAERRLGLWKSLPNFLADDVPEGGENEGEEIRRAATDEQLVTGESYLKWAKDLIDLERAAKISGSRFGILKGGLVRLELALAQLAIEELGKAGFMPLMVPQLINGEAMAGMGYLDKHADEVYKTQDDLYLIGTSEQAMGAMHRDEIFEEESLPRRYVGYSSCFRREAGSHGKDVKGIMRLHQFNKVEMFSFCASDQSEKEHSFLLARQEELMGKLKLPYRVVKLASRDLGGPAAKTYDIETWMPGENKWRETHSTSNTTDYQARRLNIRVKQKDGRVEKAHMLNGTAFAIQRILIAIMENYRQDDGNVLVPEALQKYAGIEVIEV